MINDRGIDEVGYKCPPKSSQFKSGKSGNKRGRLPKSKNRKTIVSEVAQELHNVQENGEQRRLSTIEFVLLSIRNAALSGKSRAFRRYHDLITKYDPEQNIEKGGFLIIYESGTDEEVEKEIEEQQRKYRS